MKPLPVEEQIRALLQGRGFDMARSLFGLTVLSGNEYAKVFTVKREEVLAYVQEFGFPPGCYYDRPRQGDGPYMLEDEGEYVIYCQERGQRLDETRHKSKAKAQAIMVDLLLGLSGTGLYGRD